MPIPPAPLTVCRVAAACSGSAANEENAKHSAVDSPSLKRKPSHESISGEASKKRRLSEERSPAEVREDGGLCAQDEGRAQEGNTDLPDEAVAEAAPERRPGQPVDERKRGKRLFGAIFGALGQNVPDKLAKRREIEKKQREKLKAQAEEDDAAREDRLAQLREARTREQRRFDREGTRIRHSNMLAMAHCLHTEAEPRIYYRPWELRQDEEERIKNQVRDTEELIARETAEDEGIGESQRLIVQESGETHGWSEGEPADVLIDQEGSKELEISKKAQDEHGRQSESCASPKPSSTTLYANGHGVRKDDEDETEDVHGEDAVIY